MPNNLVPILIAVLVGGVVIAAIAYHIARLMRGTIKISLPATAFNPGDTITGSFDLHTKKTIQGNKLIVSLIGVQITKTYRNGKTGTTSREIYRDERLVEDAKEYPAGHTARYEFEIPTPNTNVPEFMNSTLGQTLGAALHLLGNRQTFLNWRIEARLDAKGVDLATSRQVTVNM